MIDENDDRFRRVAHMDTLDYWVERIFRFKGELARFGMPRSDAELERFQMLDSDLKEAQIRVDHMLRAIKVKVHYSGTHERVLQDRQSPFS